MTIIDKRKTFQGNGDANRKRFLDRHKESIRDQVERAGMKRRLTDKDENHKIRINKKDLSEPEIQFDPNNPKGSVVLPGNDKYVVGDKIDRPKTGKGRGNSGGNSDEMGEDDFVFNLTKEEFYNIYFEGLGLPRFIKESIATNKKFKWKQAGYTRYGIPARLNIKKTFEMAMARKIATRALGKKPRYLDDVDIRYNLQQKVPQPVRKAVMFCLMDVSGSMGELEKMLSKKFYTLLYVFLEREYQEIELVFVRYTTQAKEVDETEFFYGKENGGTLTSTGVKLVNEIIRDRYPVDENNIYVCHCSDGDNWYGDGQVVDYEMNQLLPKCQYYIYIQVEDLVQWEWKNDFGDVGMIAQFNSYKDQYNNIVTANINGESDIYPVFRELFKLEE